MNRRRRLALTLLELVVVLLILIALAGALIPLLSGYTQRAHGASNADQLTEIAKYVQHFRLDFRRFPADLDALTTDGPAAWGGLPGTVATYATVVDYTQTAATDEKADALKRAGIDSLFVADSTVTVDHATDDYYASGAASVALADVDAAGPAFSVLELTAAAEARLGLDTSHTYVMVGLGAMNDSTGKLVHSVPVHFQEDGTPEDVYSYYALIFQVTDGGTALEKARFIAAAAIHDEGPDGTSAHISEYYEALPE